MKWFFALANATGPRYYRQLLPIKFLAKHLASRGVTVKASKELSGAADADVCFFSRNIGAELLPVVMLLKRMGKTIVWDLDDDLFIPHRWDNKDHHRVAQEIMSLRECVWLADHVTVSMDALGKVTGRNYTVLPNRIDLGDWPIQPLVTEGNRVLYAGTSSHRNDIELIRRLYHETKRKWNWHFFGINPGFSDRFATYIPLTSIRDYPRICRLVRPRVTFAPIQPETFNESKSPIKVWEMATLGSEIVATDFGPYVGHPRAIVPPGEEFTADHVEEAMWMPSRNPQIIACDHSWQHRLGCEWRNFFDGLVRSLEARRGAA